MLVIGDVHGKLSQYFELIKNTHDSICVGDFGFKKQWDNLHASCTDRHKINMGNHDYYPYLNTSPNSVGDWSYNSGYNLFTVRGANSIDKHLRTEGVDWFSNEELTYAEGCEAYDNYIQLKPEIVITHDCPQNICKQLSSHHALYEMSTTRQLLQAMFEAYQPKLWLFGHHHMSKEIITEGCKFKCLKELETYTI